MTAKPITESERVAWDARYHTGPTPWDTQVTPPEVLSFWRSHSALSDIQVLDIGAGRGTNAAFLALRGLQVTALDIAGLSLNQARHRLTYLPDSVRRRIAFVQASAHQIPLMSATFGYILDIGCLHGLPRTLRGSYLEEICRLGVKGGYYHLFAFESDSAEQGDRGQNPEELRHALEPEFHLIESIQGRPDRAPCRWYLFQRR